MASQRTVLRAGALGLAVLALPAQAGTRTTAEILYSEDPQERAFQESAGYSDAVILRDGTIYLSGVVVGPSTDRASFERTYRRISDILLRAGATWEDVVDITSYHTDIEPQVAIMSEVQKQFITPPFAAWTAVQVSRLYSPGGVTEIKIIAKKQVR